MLWRHHSGLDAHDPILGRRRIPLHARSRLLVIEDLDNASQGRREQEILVVRHELDVHIVEPPPAQQRLHAALGFRRMRPLGRFFRVWVQDWRGHATAVVMVMAICAVVATAATARVGFAARRAVGEGRRGGSDVQELELLQPAGQQALADHLDIRLLERPVGVEAAQLQLRDFGLVLARSTLPRGFATPAFRGGGGRRRVPGAFLALRDRDVHGRVAHVAALALREHLREDVDPLVKLGLGCHVLGRTLVFVGARDVDA